MEGKPAAAAPLPPPLPRVPTVGRIEQRFHLRLEYITERQTRVILVVQRLSVSAAMSVLILMVVAQASVSYCSND